MHWRRQGVREPAAVFVAQKKLLEERSAFRPAKLWGEVDIFRNSQKNNSFFREEFAAVMKTSVRSQLREKIFSTTRKGNVFPSSDLLGIGSRAAVDKALSRMVNDGEINRIAPGLYEIPQLNERFKNPVPTDPEEVARAWTQKNKARLLPNGIDAANALWLSDQISGQYEYLKDRPSAVVQVGNWKLRFNKTAPSLMLLSGRITGLVVQALRSLGRTRLDENFVVGQLKKRLSPAEKEQLVQDMKLVPVWMRPILEQVVV